MRLSWLENAYSRPLIRQAMLIREVGQTDLVFVVRPGFISRLQDYKYLCAAVTICATLINIQTLRPHFDHMLYD